MNESLHVTGEAFHSSNRQLPGYMHVMVFVFFPSNINSFMPGTLEHEKSISYIIIKPYTMISQINHHQDFEQKIGTRTEKKTLFK